MKSIEERAEAYAWSVWPNPMFAQEREECKENYLIGAIEQNAIDDAKFLKLKSSWEKEAQINHDDVANYKQGYHDAIEKACEWLEAYIACGISPEGTYGFVARFRKAMEE